MGNIAPKPDTCGRREPGERLLHVIYGQSGTTGRTEMEPFPKLANGKTLARRVRS